MVEILDELSENLRLLEERPITPRFSNDGATDKKVYVAITGSTGSFGSYLLDSMVRAKDAKERQAKSSKAPQLRDGINEGKSTFITIDIGEDYLGLERDNYIYLQNSIQHLIHNAWLVDFNLPLSSFKPHLRGMSSLIELCANGPAPIHFTFLSSVGATNNWGVHHEGPVAERVIHSNDCAEECGYAQSKLVAEQLLDRASRSLRKTEFQSTICRTTQIAGPVNRTQGMWKKSEWFPSLLQSSKTLGVLPRHLGSMNTLDWVPIDQLADAVTELVTTTDSISIPLGEVKVLHAVNPRRVEWSEISGKAAQLLFGNDFETRLVDLEEWTRQLQESELNISQQEMSENPSLKLLD